MMNLTQRQQMLVQRYMRDAAVALESSGLSERMRDQALEAIQSKIDRQLGTAGHNGATDEEILALLSKLGPADQQAEWAARRAPSPKRGWSLEMEGRVWLGVCAGLSRFLDFPAWMVRAVTVLLGLVLGPFALIAYLACFIGLYVHPGHPDLPKIRVGLALGRLSGVAIAAALLGLTGHYAVRMLYFSYEQLLKRPVPQVGDWSWLAARESTLFFWAFLCCAPVAALSAMPLSRGWEYSLKRAAQAGLVLYGIVLSFGIASCLVGIILDFVAEFSAGRAG